MTTPNFSSRLETPNLLVIETHGALDAVGMEVALSMLVAEMEGMHHGGVLIRAEGVEWPSLGAIGVELRHWVQLMAMVEKVDKVALLTDRSWVKTLAGIESALIPNLVIKSFPPDAEAEARDWLAAPLSVDATAS
ncbi:SpoIIAA family protein [Rhodophyticola porphyridii]|uniref:STAS/SEC14 domain-containing protein n=1 Tax=Rhodophyticola porphyridii TaxID=1852017 RepID=A0A3L9Y316_9RHOB|nr:STAS/SEC14 domain-containing protein [Rhodophyticola porphyridii]RMA41865.1 STAS/SEC14 domain-containing protein [Rhodophyticola porphyridii]